VKGYFLPGKECFLTIEVGSTITKVNGFNLLKEGRFAHFAQGFAPTSVAQGDVRIGVDQAITDLEKRYGELPQFSETFVNSSAAGGLRMTVHGLTYNMTARAAHEAALGAGAIVKLVTAGPLDDIDLEEIRGINPNIILLAGGVDHGEKQVVVHNARKLAAMGLKIPLVYAGNSAIRKHIEQILTENKIEFLLADNVFPEVDVLNVEPLRHIIHEVFNRNIIHAPGMTHISELSRWEILPTPGAVLKGAELFAQELGDCLVFDVGGATTDVHSVTDGSQEWSGKMIEPEPHAKRTVEGDLGVYLNAHNVMNLSDEIDWKNRIVDLQAIPSNERQKDLTRWLCTKAVEIGIRRHAGVVSDMYTPSGKKQIVKGKDLTAIKWVIGTGGALTRIEGGENILRQICTGAGKYLLPKPESAILLDRDYRFSALGTLAQAFPAEVKATFRHWVESEGIN
jgi:uncharacterized protein (TIGR01319 family)